MTRKFSERLTGNLGLKLIALLIGFLIWLFVTNNNDPVRSIMISNVAINMINEDSVADIGKVVEAEGSGTVTLKVTERRSVLNRLSRTGSNFYVEANLENLNEMNTVPLTVTCDNTAVTWDEIAIQPSSLKVTLDDKVEQAFSVTVSSSGDVSTGYAVGKTEIEGGKNILIAGPKSLVGIINQVTAPIVVSGLATDTELTSVLRVYDRNGAELTESQMNSLEFKYNDGTPLTEHTVTVLVSLWEMRADVPLVVETTGSPSFGYRIASTSLLPSSVTLIGTDEAFEQMGDSLQIRWTVNVEGASENVTEEIDLSETLTHYKDLRLPADADPMVSVEVQIEKTGDVAVDIPLGNISLKNRPSGMKLIFTPADKITIGVHSIDGSLVDLSAEDIKTEMDLSVCETGGTYEIPVTVTLPEGYELSQEIQIKVSAAVDENPEAQNASQSDLPDAEIKSVPAEEENGSGS